MKFKVTDPYSNRSYYVEPDDEMLAFMLHIMGKSQPYLSLDLFRIRRDRYEKEKEK